jgi:thioredoxin-dependent peroxiredoxin
MKLSAPSAAPALYLIDVQGEPVFIGGAGRRTLLSFFRDAACPFCNDRIFELTHHHRTLSGLGLDVVAVFGSPHEDVLRFIARTPRPFRVVADPDANSHMRYGVERSFWRKLRAVVLHMPTLVRGLRITGFEGLMTNNLMPADFLIDEYGVVAEAYYGSDAGDRIPMERIELFLARGLVERGIVGPQAAPT